MPLFFQKRFLPLKDIILKGSTDPDTLLKDFQNHIYNFHSKRKEQDSVAFFRDNFECLVNLIKQRASDSEIARRLGLFSHYIADINQPLHTEGKEVDPNEGVYHAKFEKDVEGHLSKIKVLRFTYAPVNKPVERLIEMATAANKHYSEIGKAYTSGNKIFDLMPLVSEQYNAAVKNVVDYWLGTFKEAGVKEDFSPPPEVPEATGALNLSVVASGVDARFSGGFLPPPVNINTAPLDQLMTIPGVGEKKAKAIIAGRPYKSIYDLAKVKGFGIKMIERIAERLTVSP